MGTQVVKPAGVGHESLWVVILSAVIVAVAGLVVSLRVTPEVKVEIPAHQIDARRDLTVAEQGLYADLLVAVDEIDAIGQDVPPTIAVLSEEGLSPFFKDVTAVQRGSHVWQEIHAGDDVAYLGVTADTEIAGSLLLRLPQKKEHAGHGHDEGQQATAAVWLNRTAQLAAPTRLSDEELIRTGWRHVVSQFDAGVTRQTR
jgi:hypothetical protein